MLGGKILVVDDEQEVLELLDIELSTEGYQVIKAGNSEDAIQKAKHSLPDLILMDIVMPGMDGAQAVKLLKNAPSTSNIPIIFLTAMVAKQERGITQGGVKIEDSYYPVIAKPFNHQELLGEVKKVFERKEE